MAHTRRLQGIAHDITGLPWANKQIWITRTPTQFAAHALLPVDQTKLTTDSDGAYSVDLEVNATYLVELVGSDTVSGSTRHYAPGSRFTIVVPDGDTPVSLEMLHADAITPPGDPTLINMVAQVASDLTTHEGDTANPHAVTAAQVGLGNVADLAPADLPVSTATQDALDLKADAADLAAHKQDATNPHGVTAAQLPDLDTEVSASPDVAANTAARHTHANKTTLDQTQEPYTTADKGTLDALALAKSGYGDIVTHDASEFATAAQGALADTAVQIETDPTVPSWAKQPSKPSYTKAEIGLGNVTNDAQVVKPAVAGVRGQVLTIGASANEWRDVPGIVYPSLLLSPDGSFDRSGPVSPTVAAGVSVVAGQYGNAWKMGGSTNDVSILTPRPAQVTIIVRGKFVGPASASVFAWPYDPSADRLQAFRPASSNGISVSQLNNIAVTSANTLEGQWFALATQLRGSQLGRVWLVTEDGNTSVAAGSHSLAPLASSKLRLGYFGQDVIVEAAAIYPAALPQAELLRVITMPSAWSFSGIAAHMYQPVAPWELFCPTHQTASGTTNLRVAPDNSAPVIKAMSVRTPLQVSSVIEGSHTRVNTQWGEGWVNTSQIVSL